MSTKTFITFALCLLLFSFFSIHIACARPNKVSPEEVTQDIHDKPDVETSHPKNDPAGKKGLGFEPEALFEQGKDAEGIIEMLNDESPFTRSFGAMFSRKLESGSEIVLPHLISALDDVDFGVRQEVMMALLSLGLSYEDIIVEISRTLNDTNPENRKVAVENLGMITGRYLSFFIAIPEEEQDNLVILVIPHLITALEDLDYNVRNRSIGVLSTIAPQDANLIPHLLKMLKKRCEQPCWNINTLFASIGAESLPYLLSEIDTSNVSYLIRIIDALTTLRLSGVDTSAAIPVMIGLLDEKDVSVKAEAVGFLGHSGKQSKDALAKLKQMEKEEEDSELLYLINWAIRQIEADMSES